MWATLVFVIEWTLRLAPGRAFSFIGGGGQCSGDLDHTGPKPHPKSRNTKKHHVHAEPCNTSQETNGNCSEKIVQVNFFILGGFFRVDFPCEIRPPKRGPKIGAARRLSRSVRSLQLVGGSAKNRTYQAQA